MTFLEESDFEVVIRSNELSKILGTVNPMDKLSQATDIALDEMVSFITGRYDAQATLTATGTGRNKLVVARLVDMALYHLYSGIAPQNIPNLRRDRYVEAVELFKAVSKGTRFLDLPLIPIQEQTGYFLFGSNPKFDYFL